MSSSTTKSFDPLASVHARRVHEGKVKDGATSYALRVLHGEIEACPKIHLSCRRHLSDLARQGTAEFPYVWNVDTAARPVRFARNLKHWEGEFAGKLFEPMPWQEFILGSIFGWLRESDGKRRFRYAYIELPRKNGKSFLASVVALYMLVADKEEGAQVFSAATKKDQAKIVWNAACVIAKKSGIPGVSLHWLSLRHTKSNSRFEPLSADSKTQDGLNPHCAVVDELHEWPDRNLWDVIEDAFGSRSQPLMFVITTAGFNQASICWQQHQHAVNLISADPKDPHRYKDETYFAFIADVDESALDPKRGGKEDAWKHDEKLWRMANPCLGQAKNLDFIRDQVNKAELMPSKANAVKNKQMNIWTQTGEVWLNIQKWDACNLLPVNPEKLVRQRCFSGLDLSSVYDLTANVLLFPPNEIYPEFSVLTKFYLPKENIGKRSKQDRVIYEDWVDAGFITLTPGDLIDLDFVFHDMLKLKEKYNIVECGFDPWKAVEIATKLTAEGLNMVQMRQGHGTLGPPSLDLELKVQREQIRFGGNPVLRWMATNAAALRDTNDNVRPDKKASTARIDGIVALIMALGRTIVQPGHRKSKYETESLIVV